MRLARRPFAYRLYKLRSTKRDVVSRRRFLHCFRDHRSIRESISRLQMLRDLGFSQVNVFDLNFFVLKAILGLEPGHPICLVRTFVLGLAACPAAAEVHAFLSSGQVFCQSPTALKVKARRRLGVQAWLLMAVLASETLLILRWAPTGVPHWNVPAPAYSLLLFLVLTSLTVFTALWLLFRPRQAVRSLKLS